MPFKMATQQWCSSEFSSMFGARLSSTQTHDITHQVAVRSQLYQYHYRICLRTSRTPKNNKIVLKGPFSKAQNDQTSPEKQNQDHRSLSCSAIRILAGTDRSKSSTEGRLLPASFTNINHLPWSQHPLIWVWLKKKPPEDHRCWSIFPFTSRIFKVPLVSHSHMSQLGARIAHQPQKCFVPHLSQLARSRLQKWLESGRSPWVSALGHTSMGQNPCALVNTQTAYSNMTKVGW